MKILFTGGGTGGHFYPIIAVVEELDRMVLEKKLLAVKKYYMASMSFDEQALFEHDMIYLNVPAGKWRRYASARNFFDMFRTAFGVLKAAGGLFFLFPDIVFGKGGYDSFPALLAARVFGIPVIIHESDSTPGRVNLWAGKFAKRIAVGFPEAAQFFPKGKVAYTGNPVRRDLYVTQKHGAQEFLNLEPGIPVIAVLGGSQGAKVINEALFNALPQLVEQYQIIHQTGKANEEDAGKITSIILENSPHKNRYKPFGFLNTLALKMTAGAADIIISRAGAGTISEIALWGTPAILIPISEAISHDQRSNAYAYARTGAATVIEEKNLSASVLCAEINRITGDTSERERMSKAAKEFAQPDAAKKIAEELLAIALEHEQ